MTDIERLRKRITDSLKRLTRDTDKLFDMLEGRGKLIDALARENERFKAMLRDVPGDTLEQKVRRMFHELQVAHERIEELDVDVPL